MYEKELSVVLHFSKQKGKKNFIENVINQWSFTFILKCHDTEQPALEFIFISKQKMSLNKSILRKVFIQWYTKCPIKAYLIFCFEIFLLKKNLP